MAHRNSRHRMAATAHRERALEFLRVARMFQLGELPTEQPHPDTRGLSRWARTDLARAVSVLKDIDLRAIDYLETREDIDCDKLAFYGVSAGASMGPLLTAVEPRFKASVLLAGGLERYPADWPPAAVPQNFAPRSRVPTIMINGRKDFQAPVETNIRPLFDMLGTPDEHKRMVLLDGGHVPSSPNDVIRAVLDWLDLYLGPVHAGN